MDRFSTAVRPRTLSERRHRDRRLRSKSSASSTASTAVRHSPDHLESDFAGRAYATGGCVCIAASRVWLWIVEQQAPDRWDLIGAAIGVVGAALIRLGPPAAT